MIDKAMAHVWSKQTWGVTWSRWCGIRECSLLSGTVVMTLGLWRRKYTSKTLVGYSLNEIYINTCQSGFIVEKHCKVFQRQRGLRQGIRSSCDHWKDWICEKEATTSRIVGPPCARWIWSSGSCNCPRGVKGAGNHPRSYPHSAGPRAGGWRVTWNLAGSWTHSHHCKSGVPATTSARERMAFASILPANIFPNASHWTALNGILLREYEGNAPPPPPPSSLQ